RFADWAIAGKEDRTLSNGSDGVLVPFDLQSELVTILNGVAGARQCVDVKTIGYDVEVARVASRPSITGYTGETVAYNDVESTFDSVRSYAFKSTAITTITEELMQDARPAVLAEIMSAQMDAHGLYWDKEYLVDGAGGAVGPEAIFNAGQAGLNNTLTGTSGEISLDVLMIAALEGLPAQYRGGNFSFLMHPTVESVLRREKDESGRFQLLPQASGTDAGMPGSTIHG
ncbi:MAG: phage major capsid protein, partial [Actinomycetales bacterium]|nr:phage major capsid protein [Actinomycetales bacterium]